jgi:hypothetical protein
MGSTTAYNLAKRGHRVLGNTTVPTKVYLKGSNNMTSLTHGALLTGIHELFV